MRLQAWRGPAQSPSSPAPPRRPPAPTSASFLSPSSSIIGDLRSLVASHINSLQRRLDDLHGTSVRDLEASHTRISKRIKMQTQGCLQLAEEADKEHRKMADKISERCEVVKTSYKKFVSYRLLRLASVCKVTVPEMAKSAERSIDGLLHSRYNVSATPA